MTLARTDLLSALSPISRTDHAAAEVGGARGSALGAPTFASLLNGLTGLGGGGAVTFGEGVGVSISDAQAARLAEATDRAARAGARDALVVLDGLMLRVDVSKREVTQSVSLAHGDVLTGIDAIVEASEDGGAGLAGGAHGAPGVLDGLLRSGLVSHPDLLRVLGAAA